MSRRHKADRYNEEEDVQEDVLFSFGIVCGIPWKNEHHERGL